MNSQLKKTILAITLIGAGSINAPAQAISISDKIFTGFLAGSGCASAIGAYIFGKEAYFDGQTLDTNIRALSFSIMQTCNNWTELSKEDRVNFLKEYSLRRYGLSIQQYLYDSSLSCAISCTMATPLLFYAAYKFAQQARSNEHSK